MTIQRARALLVTRNQRDLRASSEAANNVDECNHGRSEFSCPGPRHEIMISRDLVELVDNENAP
jgi:hypothetical protein